MICFRYVEMGTHLNADLEDRCLKPLNMIDVSIMDYLPVTSLCLTPSEK